MYDHLLVYVVQSSQFTTQQKKQGQANEKKFHNILNS